MTLAKFNYNLRTFTRDAFDQFIRDNHIKQLILEPEDWKAIAMRCAHTSYHQDGMRHFNYHLVTDQVVVISMKVEAVELTEILDLAKA